MKKLKIKEARVYADDPDVVFIFNGVFWTPVKRNEISGVIPTITIVSNGKKYICFNATIDEALANYEKCSN